MKFRRREDEWRAVAQSCDGWRFNGNSTFFFLPLFAQSKSVKWKKEVGHTTKWEKVKRKRGARAVQGPTPGALEYCLLHEVTLSHIIFNLGFRFLPFFSYRTSTPPHFFAPERKKRLEKTADQFFPVEFSIQPFLFHFCPGQIQTEGEHPGFSARSERRYLRTFLLLLPRNLHSEIFLFCMKLWNVKIRCGQWAVVKRRWFGSGWIQLRVVG